MFGIGRFEIWPRISNAVMWIGATQMSWQRLTPGGAMRLCTISQLYLGAQDLQQQRDLRFDKKLSNFSWLLSLA